MRRYIVYFVPCRSCCCWANYIYTYTHSVLTVSEEEAILEKLDDVKILGMR